VPEDDPEYPNEGEDMAKMTMVKAGTMVIRKFVPE
jgi:hypothetical protein